MQPPQGTKWRFVLTRQSDDIQPKWLPKRGQEKRLEEVDNFKYLGSISIEVSKLKVLIRVAQETATLFKLKIIGGTEHLHLHLKHDVDTHLIFLYACKSLILAADLSA